MLKLEKLKLPVRETELQDSTSTALQTALSHLEHPNTYVTILLTKGLSLLNHILSLRGKKDWLKLFLSY